MTQQQDQNQNDEILDLENELQQEIDEATHAEEELQSDIDRGAISSAEEELVRLRESLARAQADYTNLLKRVDRDRADMTAFITANVIKKMLPTMDHLERAVANTPAELQENAWVKGVLSIHGGLTKQFESLGVKSYESMGKEVDTEYHEVMSQAPGTTGVIIAEFEKGYMIGDRVIRHAKVVVGSGE